MKKLFLVMAVLLAGLISGCGFGSDDVSTSDTGTSSMMTYTPRSLVAKNSSVLMVKVCDEKGVTMDDKGFLKCVSEPVAGVDVSFGVRTNNSGGTLDAVRTKTDGQGIALATFTAGENNPNLEVEDIISAEVAGEVTDVAVIKRLPAAGTGIRILSFTEDPETSQGGAIGPPWENVIMKVKVTTDNTVTPVAGWEVTFSIIMGGGILTNADSKNSGSSIKSATDDNGEAYVTFTRPATGSGDTVIQAQILGQTSGGDAARIVYWTDDCFVNTCCGQ